jgi:YHS domain-containing protein
MKRIPLFIGVVLYASLLACGRQPTAHTANPALTASHPKRYPLSLVDNKTDTTCGMPLTAGIEDTLHYKGRVLGFCSTECKNEFVKNNPAK